MTPSERARTLEAGSELDALFFETCWGWRKEMLRDPTTQDESKWSGAWLEKERMPWTYCRPVSTDANACEAWAMRWAREKGLRYEIAECADKVRVRLYDWQGRDFGGADLWMAQEYGENFKEAFVRACVAAGEQLETNGETKQ